MALPLKVGSRVIGVLDVQSQERGAFTEEDVVILQTMADQLAVAIENARLFQEVQDSLRQVEALYGQYSQQSWQKIIETNRISGYRYEPGGSAPLVDWDQQEGEPAQADNPLGIKIPLRVRGHQIGVLEVLPNPDHWTDDNLIFLAEVSERLSQALESARLYQESQLRAASEQLVSGITGRMRATLDVDNVLQTAAREIRQALNLQEVEIRLGLGNGTSAE
jgi:transcriptional regulator with GAF, ATPase, and Fis domain